MYCPFWQKPTNSSLINCKTFRYRFDKTWTFAPASSVKQTGFSVITEFPNCINDFKVFGFIKMKYGIEVIIMAESMLHFLPL
jgi:hypothetical protein